ncbi:MAG: hypothetical protein MR891_04695 [Bacteroidales bacterium]|nr:hypothetical protein [Bacteroidales bacterium]
MLKESKLSEYLEKYPVVVWVPDMPDGVPPEEISIPNEHVLYRLTKGEKATEEDLTTYFEKDPNKDWGNKLAEAYAVSLYDDLGKTSKLLKLASLKKSKGVSRFILNPENGVVKQTGKSYHYSWWKTNKIDINRAETVKQL